MPTSEKSPSRRSKSSKKSKHLTTNVRHPCRIFLPTNLLTHTQQGTSNRASTEAHRQQENTSTTSSTRQSHDASTTWTTQTQASASYDDDNNTSATSVSEPNANVATSPGYDYYQRLPENDLLGIGAWAAQYVVPAATDLSLQSVTPSGCTQTAGETHQGVGTWESHYDAPATSVSGSHNTTHSL